MKKKIVNALIVAGLIFPFATFAKDADKKVAKPKIEVCFVLDTTGSMGGLIEGAKQKIWSIANDIATATPAPDIRFALVPYRDRGDEYVVKTFDLTNDLDAVYANLRSFRAEGGGDFPESVNEALDAAVRQISWSTDRRVLKMIFLVGDAPPHMDYPNAPKYPEVCQAAMKKDLVINTIQCGSASETTKFWQDIAKLSEGSYAAIPENGNVTAIATPMDAKLAELNREVGATLVAYGSASARREVFAKQAVSEMAPAAAAAVKDSRPLQVMGRSVHMNDVPHSQKPRDFSRLMGINARLPSLEMNRDRSPEKAITIMYWHFIK